MENTYVITVTLTKESDRDNLLEMLNEWELDEQALEISVQVHPQW